LEVTQLPNGSIEEFLGVYGERAGDSTRTRDLVGREVSTPPNHPGYASVHSLENMKGTNVCNTCAMKNGYET
jgi:hypothetical protein